ncbi:MAG TPA: thioredoxin family protein [Stellaceae bacterium]|nr:thioredoxin family protein [Stellaceae bacterium]
MKSHPVASHDEWIEARKQLLAKEKEFTRLRDQLSQQRRDLPWERVEKPYVFDGPSGKETLSDLFEGRQQLIVYHFMFDTGWDAGCKSCSFWADNLNGIVAHLKHRDVTLLAVSRAPLAKLETYKKRMGWTFKWVSSAGSDFNRDYHVSHTPEELEKKEAYYNYTRQKPYAAEAPGISVFYRDPGGAVFHTYSCYARGLDMLNGAYHLLDLVPKGRDEANLPSHSAWLRRHDEYVD